jgi:hypothetical protein
MRPASRMATQPAAQTWQTPPAAASPPPAPEPVHNPMATHLKVIAVLEIVWGVLAAVGALFILMAFSIGAGVTGSVGAPGFVPGLIATFGVFLVVLVGGLAALALVGGTRLLKLRRSGKVPTYITAALSLLSFPIGTAFAVYAFIILTRPDTDRLLVNP